MKGGPVSLFQHMPHPHITHRRAVGPATVDAQHDRSSAVARFNAAVAVTVTKAVGSMWCAYAFAILALVGLPGAIQAGTTGIIQWVAQTFLQLVLLSVIIVGQNVQAAAADKRAVDTYNDAESILHECLEMQRHLAEQDKVLIEALGRLST